MDQQDEFQANKKSKPQLKAKVAQVATLYNPRTWKEKGLWWSLGLFGVT